jgi:hypothetical protein
MAPFESLKQHRAQPSVADIVRIGGLKELTKEQKEGLAIAAYICGMYANGDGFAEVIMLHGEQQRARYWMRVEESQQRVDLEKAADVLCAVAKATAENSKWWENYREICLQTLKDVRENAVVSSQLKTRCTLARTLTT